MYTGSHQEPGSHCIKNGFSWLPFRPWILIYPDPLASGWMSHFYTQIFTQNCLIDALKDLFRGKLQESIDRLESAHLQSGIYRPFDSIELYISQS
jgi:hypothetical protein